MTSTSTLTRAPSMLTVSVALAGRAMRRLLRRPSLFIPTVVMPVFFVVAFTGSFSGISRVDGYGTDNIYNWMTPYAIIQGSAFAGVGAAGMTAEDIENGFFDRLLLAPGHRLSLLAGPVLYSTIRSLIPTTVVLLVAWVIGPIDFTGGPLGVALLYLGSAGIATLFGLLGLNAVYLIRSQRALLLVQLIVFSTTFLSIGQVPLSFQSGWLHAVARLNPMTNMLRMVRQGFLGPVEWGLTWPGLVALAALIIPLGVLAQRQLARLAP